jgi:hypothetical protein
MLSQAQHAFHLLSGLSVKPVVAAYEKTLLCATIVTRDGAA